MPNHNHAEAFNLMRYTSDDGTESEVLWNSRDGVTPFVVSLRSGKHATHGEWHLDEYAPTHVPGVGDRIFVDLTRERAVECARANLKRWEAEGMSMLGAPTAVELAASYMQPGAPDLIEVTTENLHRWLPEVKHHYECTWPDDECTCHQFGVFHGSEASR